jgi:chromosome segregation ATPase
MLETENQNIKESLNKVEMQMQTEKEKKLVLQKANSYMTGEIFEVREKIKSLNSNIDHDECNSNLVKLKQAVVQKDEELADRDLLIQDLQESLSVLKNETIETRNVKGIFNENVRLSIMELAGLEVAIEKMSPVIQCVMKHLCGKDLRKDQLPNPATAQAIVDEGHYITKTFIANKLEQC